MSTIEGEVQEQTQTRVKQAVLSSTVATGLFFSAPLISEAAFGDEALVEGMNDEDVMLLQQTLKEKGHFQFETATGYYGSITKEAVASFQQAVGLPATGEATRETLDHLLADAKSSTEAKVQAAATSTAVLQQGVTNTKVYDLQAQLRAAGYFAQEPTGYYGRATTEAIRSFQREQGLQVDGIAGPQTLTELANVTAVSIASVTAKSTTSQSTLLRNGSRGDAVRDLQKLLRDLGHYTGSVDGIFGKGTDAAVRELQRANGLAVDGIVGQRTLSALQGSSSVSSAGTAKPQASQQTETKAQLLRNGSRGTAVTELQQRLRDLGYYTGSVDGIFGAGTDTAVRELQRTHKIGADGIVGPKTWDLLGSSSAAKPSSKEADKLGGSGTVSSSTSLMKVGSQGEHVRSLQQQLKTIGLTQEVTGYYGTVTEQAVRAFQRQYGLSVDGIAGKATIAKLNELAGLSVSSAEADFNVMNVVADASELLGIPYVWGGTTTAGFDCSGFIYYVFSKNHKQVARTVAGMWDTGSFVSKPAVGDLVFFETYATGPTHAGIYIGNDQFVHSGTSTGVTVANLNTKYWKDRYLGAKRLH